MQDPKFLRGDHLVPNRRSVPIQHYVKNFRSIGKRLDAARPRRVIRAIYIRNISQTVYECGLFNYRSSHTCM